MSRAKRKPPSEGISPALLREAAQHFNAFVDAKAFAWSYRGKNYISKPMAFCRGGCGKFTVVELPPTIRAEQTDGTTHVCHLSIGGCNMGYAVPAGSKDD